MYTHTHIIPSKIPGHIFIFFTPSVIKHTQLSREMCVSAWVISQRRPYIPGRMVTIIPTGDISGALSARVPMILSPWCRVGLYTYTNILAGLFRVLFGG